jgi:PIN domain nuclease of toxin-antitoxin system
MRLAMTGKMEIQRSHPFDRLLLAQARTEGMLLLTVDPAVFQYQESVLAV